MGRSTNLRSAGLTAALQKTPQIKQNSSGDQAVKLYLHAFEAFILKTPRHPKKQPYEDNAESHDLERAAEEVTSLHAGAIIEPNSSSTNWRPVVVLPTYNEIQNLPQLVESVWQHAPGIQIVVVDDASPDGTGAWVAAMAKRREPLHLIARPAKLGLGSAYRAGWNWALERDFDPILTMDADFSHQPHYLPQLFGLLHQGADVAIGSRYVPGGGISDWPWNRRLLSWTANRMTRLLLRIPVRDATAGFRAYRRHVLEAIDPNTIRAEGYAFLEESLWRVHQAGFDCAESPILFQDRTRDQSKISRAEILRGMMTLLRLTYQTWQPSKKSREPAEQ